ncbi:Unknown protein, partial [Striga hermonthica]
GITRGLWVLSSFGESCLRLNGRGVFVCNSQGKVKPCAEYQDFQSSRDLNDLRELLYTTIVYPFREVGECIDAIVKMGEIGGEYSLDLEMQYFFFAHPWKIY